MCAGCCNSRGLGSFEPRKPLLENLEKFEDRGVDYIIRDPEIYRKACCYSGGGDSALDWSIFLSDITASTTLVHRRNEFRGALDSVEKVQQLSNEGKIRVITEAEITALYGENKLDSVRISQKSNDDIILPAHHFIPLFGLAPKLGPISNWGLEIEKNAIKVDNSYDYQTNIPGIFAIGDVNTYKGKLS